MATSTVISILHHLDIAEHATRSAIARMVKGGYLQRRPQGRQTFLAMTEKSNTVVREGTPRIFDHPPVLEDPDPCWTLLSFSIPEARRNERHALRVRLEWLGFALLRDGLWVAAGRVPVMETLKGLGVTDDVCVFEAKTVPSTESKALVRRAWDLDALRHNFTEFVERWDCHVPNPGAASPLATDLLLITEWRLLVLETPQLPATELPAGWPARRAYEVFRQIHGGLRAEADAEFAAIADLRPVTRNGSNRK